MELADKYATKDASIAELGCNVGRNLNQLRLAGYSSLWGVEINPRAVSEMRHAYPELTRVARIINSPIEEAIRTFAVRQFDVVFSMAFLEHVHPSSEWIFPEIARVTRRVLIVIEDEAGTSWRHVPRNYQSVFEPLGLRQVEVVNCREVEGLGPDFKARVFEVKG